MRNASGIGKFKNHDVFLPLAKSLQSLMWGPFCSAALMERQQSAHLHLTRRGAINSCQIFWYSFFTRRGQEQLQQNNYFFPPWRSELLLLVGMALQSVSQMLGPVLSNLSLQMIYGDGNHLLERSPCWKGTRVINPYSLCNREVVLLLCYVTLLGHVTSRCFEVIRG